MTTHLLNVNDIGKMELSVDERGSGPTYLLLHGGGGPAYMAGFAHLLGAHGRVLTPTHPGFGGTARPAGSSTVGDLAKIYASFLEAIAARDVVVVGNSLGGWIGSELALLAPARLSRLILVNAVGIEVEGHPVASAAELSPAELMQRAFHDPSQLKLPVPSEEEQKAMAADAAVGALYAGRTSTDPTLRARLSRMKVPTTVLWGESDRLVDAVYGRAYADALPDGRFELLPRSGHVPQLETPELLLQAILRA